MIQTCVRVSSLRLVGDHTYVLSFQSPALAESILPGQFINIKVHESAFPLLRRPFSVYHVSGAEVSIIFNVVGEGTTALASKQIGNQLDVLGPLGCPFHVGGDYQTALLVAGGLGIAPLPMIAAAARLLFRPMVAFLGARNSNQIVDSYLDMVHVATDDGSRGHHGTVVDLLRTHLEERRYPAPKIFGCGPNAMLRSLSRLAAEYDIPCEVSLESVMACGIGICQGCPVERAEGAKKYSLICKEGTVFDSRTIRII